MKRQELTALLLTVSMVLASCGGTAAQSGGTPPANSAEAVQASSAEAAQVNSAEAEQEASDQGADEPATGGNTAEETTVAGKQRGRRSHRLREPQ